MKKYVVSRQVTNSNQFRTEYSVIKMPTLKNFSEDAAKFFVQTWMASHVLDMLKVMKNWHIATPDDKEDYLSFLRKALLYDGDKVRDDPVLGYTNPLGTFSETTLRWIIDSFVDDNVLIEPIVPRPPGQGDIDLIEIRGDENDYASLKVIMWEIKGSDNQASNHNSKVYEQISDYPSRFYSIANELGTRFAYSTKSTEFKRFLRDIARMARKKSAQIQYGAFITYDSNIKQNISILPNFHNYPKGHPQDSSEKCHHVSMFLLPNFKDTRIDVWRHLNLEIQK